ncbi:2-C-methyl-D-erythritol 4-phosphate cytidylyltransferase [Caloranaerobacter azorensis DSM 13643]|uniref:2-C-methyl-D-erythritol 4-phosphate cytidylyltransferase n=1 Tax=Caloranaerobacter azorensis DSM 13643 TaxID=1121264 RepID=A0A1M5VJR5_9FIRM|nr:2-C-methyl-D-erythritol 4-phosphate cytidylyltransferase [Caloranaerobacter azorensis]SHH75445.1 2-C-methyl-D-erythritol 4-phosphate cytidylyltransferase [Caloranaerobacter azorensis DSM 13643]
MSYLGKYISVIVPAAGMGKRMNSKINKQFIKIKDIPVLARTLMEFNKCDYIDEIIVVTRYDEIDFCQKEIIDKYKLDKVKKVIQGGKERQDSVYNGLKEVNKKSDIVLIHDGARPFVKRNIIEENIKFALEYGACVTGVPVKDTIKKVDLNGEIISTPNRKELWAIQTPQTFRYDLILKAYEKAKLDNFLGTDDSMLVERIGYKVKIVMGDYSNIKITTPEDLIIAETLVDK